MGQSMKQHPLVSVIMPAYNAERYIETAIRSVQTQTIEDWELIVIDDGSSDQTPGIVQRMAENDDRIQFLVNPENMGTAKTRNRGLELCQGKYVALLDSDDIWRPEKLERQIRRMEAAGADIVYCSYAIIDENGKTCCADYIVPERTTLSSILKENVIGCSTVIMSREVADKYRFVPSYYHEDFALWLQILQSGRVAAGETEVLVEYRFYAGSRASNKLASAKRRWIIYRQHMKLPLLQSIRYLSCYAFSGVKKYKTRT